MSGNSGGIVALVPVRSLLTAKTRLAGRLPPAVRATLMRRMLLRVVDAALGTSAIRAVLVVTPDEDVLELSRGIQRVRAVRQPQTAPGLLPALELGRHEAEQMGAAALLVLFGDLPLLESADLENIVRRAVPVVIAPDRHGAGTNALLVRLSAITGGEQFAFQFGEGSYARHVAEAHRLGLDVATSISAGTAFDLDTPDDLEALLADPRWSDAGLWEELLVEAPLDRAS